jgi:Carboxypeptidase regulatory-like domain
MVRPRVVIRALAQGLLLLAPASLVFGQGIAGVVRDPSGGVLPGVTVEASSPALIEQTRTVVSDAGGQYSIIDLRPGMYAVTFSLPGFSTVKREGIVLTTGFTANVNAELAVGALDETVVVSAESPIVDTRTVRETAILENEVIEALPTGRTTTGLATLIPGIAVSEGGRKFQDVGGLAGEGNNWVIHGSRSNEGHVLISGLPFHSASRSNNSIARNDVSMVEEFALETSAISAEYAEGGVTTNLIGKEGGNRFTGFAFGSYSGERMQGSNYDDDLRARGAAAVNSLKGMYDYNISSGGPLKQNRLWYFASIRHWVTENLVAGVFEDANRHDFFYTPDLSRQFVLTEDLTNGGGRVTWQVTPKNKLQGYFQKQRRIGFTGSEPAVMPEAQGIRTGIGPGNIYTQLLWSAPVTTRLLLEAGQSLFWERTRTAPLDGLPTDSPSWGYNIVDSGLGITYNYPATIGNPGQGSTVQNHKASVSYITGSHFFRAGVTVETAVNGQTFTEVTHDMTLLLVNRVPNRITLQIQPRFIRTRLNQATGIFVTDRWTKGRVTLTPGMRFDYNNGSVPAQDQPAGRFLAARHFDEVTDVPNWKDLSPRLGVAYDVFGDGKTALKASLSRYISGGPITATALAANPVATTVNNANRNWTDLNGNFLPECDFVNPETNGECGPLGNRNFGRNVISTTIDPAITRGFGVRPYNWETTVALQHALTPRVGLNVGYYHRQYGNFTVTDNTLVTSSDYDPYCITTPVDRRLPDGGGQQLCGYYDINPAKFGQFSGNVTKAAHFGDQQDVFDGVDISISTRFGGGVVLDGGTATGRQRTNTCFTVDSPEATLRGPMITEIPTTPGSGPRAICDVRPPFQTQAKLLATVPLPWQFQVAATFQSSPGPPIMATYIVRSADIRASLGRDLSSGPNGTASVDIVPPGTLYGPRVYQVDGRVSKIVPVGRFRMQWNVDAFNIFNANPVLQHSNNYGTDGRTWLRPEGQSGVMNARLFKVSGQVTF